MSLVNRAPRVSVVVPTYGHRDLVLATLESVFAQSHPADEVIVVDDGSPDGTGRLLQPLADAGRIVLVRQENRGQAAARNRGLAEARGEYVAFLDDDDLWPADRLAWQVEILDREPRVVLVYGPCRHLRDGSEAPGPRGPHPTGNVRRALLHQYCLTSPGQATIRGSALRALGGFDESLWGVDDWDLYVRLSELGEFQFVDRVALLYRVHEQNASDDAVRHAKNAWRSYRKHGRGNPREMISLARSGAAYFVPRLLHFGEKAQFGRRRRAAAYAYAAAFQPSLLAQRQFLAGVARVFLRPGSGG